MLFFQLTTRRYEHASTVPTSNTGFEEWGEIFCDDVMAAALIDRLVHQLSATGTADCDTTGMASNRTVQCVVPNSSGETWLITQEDSDSVRAGPTRLVREANRCYCGQDDASLYAVILDRSVSGVSADVRASVRRRTRCRGGRSRR